MNALFRSFFALSLVGGVLLAGCGGQEKFASNSNGSVASTASPQDAQPMAMHVEPTSQPGKYGGSLTTATISDPKTFNYWVAGETSSTGVVGPLYESLISLNSYTLQYEDDLADLPEISKDGLTWTFKLKEGLKWSDGAPLTSDDVIFTLDMIYDAKTQGIMREGMLVDVIDPTTKKNKRVPLQYKKSDARTVEFKFPVAYAPARSMLSFPIAPRHKLYDAWKAGNINTTWGVDVDVKDLVSSGAWIITSYVPQQRIVYGRNPNFWKKDEQGRRLPYLDRRVVLIVPDLNALTIKFQAGETDVLGVQPSDYALIKAGEAKGNYKVYNQGPGWGFEYLCFNQNPESSVDSNKIKLFQTPKFREAVAYAVNRERIVKDLMLGLGQPQWSYESPANTQFYNPGVSKYEYNPTKSKQILAEMGLSDSNGNGILEYNGKDISFNIITNASNNQRVKLCTLLTQDMKNIGLKATFSGIDFNKLVASLDAKPYNWEACVLGFTGGPEPHDGANIWFSSGPSHMWRPSQKEPATPWEKQIDALYREGARTLDPAKRKKIYADAQQIIMTQLPFVTTAVQDSLSAMRNKYGNIKPCSLGGLTWNIEEIYQADATRVNP
ncbi:putative ABC transporter-binding protein [Abditibacteriota bacterium]|nr:putative ABC transporter-binding protein [Abditibacteriota bacterium]